MTLTRILPTLRRSIPDPIGADRWPATTSVSTTDVAVGEVSLLRLAEVCGTPAVHVGRAVEPGTGGRLASTTLHTGVVVVRVVEASAHHGDRAIVIDADLSELDPAWPEARLIGRASVARATPTTIAAQSNGYAALLPIALPGDLCAGDLLVLPYAAVADDAGVARPTSGWRTVDQLAQPSRPGRPASTGR